MKKDAIKDVDQDTIAPPDFIVPKNRRIGQAEVLPTAAKYRLLEFYDPTTNSLIFRSSAGTAILTINLTTGAFTFGGAVTFNTSTVTFNTLTRGLWPEIEYVLAAETNDGFFTGNDAFEFTGPAANQYITTRLNSTEWDTDVYDLYYEIIGGGDTSAIVSRIYNVTDAAAVANTEIQSTTAGAWQRVRSTTPFTLATGTKEYAVQMKRSSAAGFPSMGKAAIIARLKNL